MIWKEEDLEEINFFYENRVYKLNVGIKLDAICFNCENIGNLRVKINKSEIDVNKKLEIIESKIIIVLNGEILVNDFEIIHEFKFSEVKAYKRKYNLLIAARGDAFGSRMTAFISAMYLAKKVGFKFGFIWGEMNKNECGISLGKADEIFEEEFIKECDYSKTAGLNLRTNGNHNAYKSISELKNNFSRPYGDIFNPAGFATKKILSDLDINEFRIEATRCYFEIPFKPNYKIQITNALNLSEKLGNFVAIHMRAGDTIETITFRKALYNPVLAKYVFPVDFVIFAIRYFIQRNKKVVLFSSDISSQIAIKEYLKDEVVAKNLYIVMDLCKDLNDTQKILFETALMSKAAKIISAYSHFMDFSAFIGGNVPCVRFDEFFNIKTLYNSLILTKSKDFCQISNIQKTATCVIAYLLSIKINAPFNQRINLVNLALEFDYNNSAHRIILINEFFKAKQIDRVNKYLSNILIEREEEFLQSLFYSFWKKIAYEAYFPPYLKYANSDYPYIAYVAAKICRLQENFKEALRFAKLAHKNEPNNEMFGEILLELLPQKEKEQVITKEVIKEKVIVKETPIPNIYLASAKDRIHNHLAYKLGQAMILNSKSLLGYIRMPYVLSFIKEAHQKEQKEYQAKIVKNPKLKLPKLESYPDYKEALKEKECFTYKLGEALIKANSVRGGGRIFAYLAFFQEVRRLKREFREKRK